MPIRSAIAQNIDPLKPGETNIISLPDPAPSAGSVALNDENSFLEEYYVLLIGALIFFAIETLILVNLWQLYKKHKLQAATIIEQENRYKTLVDYNRLSELSELTASLSHQLNQPLTAILSSSQASLRFLANDKYEKKLFEEILSNIVEDVKRASEIILSLRGMIKKESREKRKVDLNLLTRDVYLLFNGQATLRDIFIETEFSYNKPYVLADPILIQQVILNLLHNAAEALEKNRKSYKRIILKTLIWDKKVFVSVSDNGPEIPDDVMKEIFKPFFTTKQSGLGIGLAICRSIISDHGGEIQASKNKDEGITFTFSLELYEEKN